MVLFYTHKKKREVRLSSRSQGPSHARHQGKCNRNPRRRYVRVGVRKCAPSREYINYGHSFLLFGLMTKSCEVFESRKQR